WVDGTLPFGDGVDYEPSSPRGPTAANDLQPASVGASGAAGATVGVRGLKLWRGPHYTLKPRSSPRDPRLGPAARGEPSPWGARRAGPRRGGRTGAAGGGGGPGGPGLFSASPPPPWPGATTARRAPTAGPGAPCPSGCCGGGRCWSTPLSSPRSRR